MQKATFHSVESFYDAIKILEQENIVFSCTNESGRLIFIMISDIIIDTGFPEFLLNLLFTMNLEEKRNKRIILEHLNLLVESSLERKK